MLRCERFALIGPFERFRHRAIEIFDKCQHFGFQFFDGGEITSFEQFTDQDAEPDLNLVHPGGMLWRVMENDPMGWVSQESCPSFHRLQNTAFAFAAQIEGEIGFVGHIAHQGFRLMGVEVVYNEVPPGYPWGGFNRVLDMLHEISFVARAATGNCSYLASSHFKVDDES